MLRFCQHHVGGVIPLAPRGYCTAGLSFTVRFVPVPPEFWYSPRLAVGRSRGQIDSLEFLLHHVACFDGRVLPESLVRGEFSERTKILRAIEKRHLGGTSKHAFPLGALSYACAR